MATKKNHLAVVEVLLEEGGADPNLKTGESRTGSALLVASQFGHYELAKLLLNYGACACHIACCIPPVLSLALHALVLPPLSLTHWPSCCTTPPFMLTVARGWVHFLHDATIPTHTHAHARTRTHARIHTHTHTHPGADPNHATIDGITPLMTAALDGHLEVAQLLMANGANPHQLGSIKDGDPFTARELVRAVLECWQGLGCVVVV
jgi:hypothetical protein